MGHYRPSQHVPLTVDWSSDQHLASGWVSARVPAHFLVRSGGHRLERLVTRPAGSGKLSATNGFGVPVSKLWLADAQGRLYTAADIPVGAEVELRPTGSQVALKLGALRQAYLRDWLSLVKQLEATPAEFLAPASYFAILDGAPFLEDGLRHAKQRQGRSAVLGIMK
jgi:hypothetical protein